MTPGGGLSPEPPDPQSSPQPASVPLSCDAGVESEQSDGRWGKSGKEEPVGVPYGANPETCPVRAWLAWHAAAGITQGRAFRSIDRHGNLGDAISSKAIGAIIVQAGAAAVLHVRYTGHSVRRGMATAAQAAGHDVLSVARPGGWSPHSPVIWGRFEVQDRFGQTTP
jgi:hypothetical protein